MSRYGKQGTCIWAEYYHLFIRLGLTCIDFYQVRMNKTNRDLKRLNWLIVIISIILTSAILILLLVSF